MEWMNLFSQHILDRGIEYCEDDQVIEFELTSDKISAVVEGSDEYEISIDIEGEQVISMECDCPYALSGQNCKHMAAVLFKWEEILSETVMPEELPAGELRTVAEAVYEQKEREIKELIEQIPVSDLKELFAGVLSKDIAFRNQLELKYNFSLEKNFLKKLKIEADQIVYRFGAQHGYIDWRSAYGFCMAYITFLDEKIPLLIEHKGYLEAFDLVNYVFYEIGTVEIDDSDGGLSEVAETCYEYWEQILMYCNEEEKVKFREWFLEEKESEDIIDYILDYISMFYEAYLMTDEEIREKLNELDLIIEDNEKLDDKHLYVSYNHIKEAVSSRVNYMKQLHLSDGEIRAYKENHHHLAVIREMEVKDALEAGDDDEAIRILIESKELDRDHSNLVDSYSRKLITLYEKLQMDDQLKEELYFHLLHFRQTDLSYYERLCGFFQDEEEWQVVICQILSTNMDSTTCAAILNKEKRYDELLDVIENGGGFYLLNQYEKNLQKGCPERMIAIYSRMVSQDIKRVTDRNGYRAVCATLKKFTKCQNGKTVAEAFANQWKNEYKRRPAFLDELKKAGF